MSGVRRFLARRGAVVGCVLVAILLGLALARPGDPNELDVDHGLSALGLPLGPSADAPLGTDQMGRDELARIGAGAGTSLTIASLATLIALVLGVGLGLVAGYAGGWVDGAVMRTVDLVLAFPFLLLVVLLAAVLREGSLGSSSAPVVLTLGFAGWATIARIVRAKAIAIAGSEHVLAARAIGAPPGRIVWRHLLPHVGGTVVVVGVLAFAQNLLAEATLSFLGLGPPPPAATWGRMLYEGRTFYRTAPHLVLAPGIAIAVSVIAVNLIGEGLRGVFDRSDGGGAR